ncbi:MAG TPA: TonB-dependent receptor [Pyrinomonadaceae bacterium]|nr:TonB-dependent receptor [Pyrinomonadaceae bacterium]
MLRQCVPHIYRFSMLVSILVLSCVAAFAQSQATTGNIEGRVVDPNGAAIPNASVTAKNQQTGLEKTVVTDTEGNYRIILLPPGSYNVRTVAQGFAQSDLTGVVVTVGGKTPLEISVTVSGVVNQVEVTGELPVVETTRTSVSTTVNQKAIENLPVNGRNYLDFATLTPGVVRDVTREGDLSVGGQKGTLNNLQVDGTDNNNTFFGQAFGRTGVRPPYQFSEESVQEFQVNQNGFSAEFGRAGGAVINVVTRSGTNRFSGGVFEYFRDEALNANTTNLKATQAQAGRLNKRPPFQINQFGGRLGGPIVKNRAFFFFTYDGQRQSLPNPVEAPNLFVQPAAIQALLLPRLGTYAISRNQDVFMIKSDITVTQNNQLSLRFNQQNFTGVNNEFTGQLATEEHSGDSLAKTTTFSGNLASTITPRIVNEFRFQFARDKEPGGANSDLPETQINTGGGFLLLGRNNFSPRETTIKRVQFIDNISYVRGAHNFKTGVDLNFDRILNFFPGFFNGQYTFNSYADFAANIPSAYTQRFGVAGTDGATTRPNSSDFAVFGQDDWRVTPKLTLNLGVRYDLQKLAQPPLRNPDPALLAAGLDTSIQPSDTNNIAPRFGFSYAFDEKTVLRGGYGIFYGRTTAIMLGTAHSGNGIQTTGITLSSNAAIVAAGLTYPNIFTSIPTGVAPPRPDLFIFTPDYAQPYVQQGRVGFEREVLSNMSFSVTYMFFKGVHLSRTRDVNLFPPVPVTATGFDGQTYTVLRFPGTGATAAAQFTSTTPLRPFANYNRISLFESTANSLYNGLAIQLMRRFTRGLQFTASYTFSRTRDDRPDQTAVVPGGGDDAKVVQNSFNIQDDWAISDVDIPHRFVFSPVYDIGTFTRSDNEILRALLSDYTFSGIVQFQSGFPYTATVGADLNRDGNSRNDRVPGLARNTFRTPNVYQFDVRVTRNIRLGETMRLRLIAEGFNIFNRSNIGPAPGGGGQGYVNTNFFRNFTATSVGGVNTFILNAPLASTAFGTPRTFLTQRQIQLAVKFDF